MKIYRKVIPRISKDVIRALLANRCIEVEEGRRDEAELDIAGVFVRYLNALDQLSEDAQSAIIRHKLTRAASIRFVKHSRRSASCPLAKKHSITCSQVINALFDSSRFLKCSQKTKKFEP